MMETQDQIQRGKITKRNDTIVDWNNKSPVLKITLMGLMVSILVISDWAFSFIPFVQLVTLLLTLYFFIFGYRSTLLILFIYVSVDCMISGGMWPIFISVPMMFIAWVSLPSLLLLTRLLRGSFYSKIWLIAILAGIHGFLFGQTFAIGNTLVYYLGMPWDQFVRGWQMWVLADIPWEVAQCVVGVVCSIVVLPGVYKILSEIMKRHT